MQQHPIWVEHRSGENLTSPRPALAVHEHVALLVVTEGSTTLEQGGRFDAGPGDVLLVPAGLRHRRVAAKNHAMWGIGFCPSCYAPSELATLLDPFERARRGASPVVRLPAERQQYVAELCAELQRETRAVHAHGELAQRSLLGLLLVEIARAAQVAPVQDNLVAEALQFIERRCLEPISLRDVAAAVRRSPAHVTTALKRATGKSVGDWITAGRLAEARNRLLHTDERVDVIAERIGYADATHFIRMFRRAHGVTPAAWRAEHRRSPARDSARSPRTSPRTLHRSRSGSA
jgi:AraC-like DNA-binding protein